MPQSSICVLPSTAESFGIVLLEAASYECVLISTELGTGASFINKHGTTGLVVSPKDVMALRNAIRQMIDDTTLCREYGKQAYQRYLKLFTEDKMVAEYHQLYQSLD